MTASFHVASFTPAELARMLGRTRRRRAALAATPGLVSAKVCATADLHVVTGGHPTLRRWVLMCGWQDRESRDAFLAGGAGLAAFTDGATEAWSLALDTVRVVRGAWHGWEPDTAGVAPFAPGEPLAVITHARLYARHVPAFQVRNRKVVRALAKDPAHVLRIGYFDHPLVRATFSLWRSEADVVAFAYRKTGIHGPAQRHSREVPWIHDNFFARFRLGAAHGTLAGRDPVAEL